MNGAHLHLIINHLPIIFPVAGILVMITGFITKSEAVKRTAYLIFILGALSAVSAMATGEGAEEIAEQLSGVTESMIEAHEEKAEVFAVLSYILGALSLAGLLASFKQHKFSDKIAVITLIFSLPVMIFAGQAGSSGGEISHPEIRDGYVAPTSGTHSHEEEESH